jgi:hypothetical protein
LADLQAQHDDWAATKACRRHYRRIGAIVGDAWRVEQGFLAPIPDPLPDAHRRTEVRVTKDGFCRIGDAVAVEAMVDWLVDHSRILTPKGDS